MSTLTMYDAIDITQIPPGATAVAGYVSGRWPTAAHLAATFPRAQLLTIAVTAADDAECLDIETGDATPADAAGWYERQKARGITRPCLYASASVMESSVVAVILAAGIARTSVRLWSAHYTLEPHICGPASCREMSIEADGTQWTDRAMGRSLDESLLVADFFGTTPPPAGPAFPYPSGDYLAVTSADPHCHSGFYPADQPHVRTWQQQMAHRGWIVPATGHFDAACDRACRLFQGEKGLGVDGKVGSVTWTAAWTAPVT